MCWRMALFWILCVILSWCPLPLGITITAYNHCLDSGALAPSDVTTLSPIGVQQCIKHCLGDRGCLSINYWRGDLKCALQRVKAGGTINLVADPTCFYIERADLPTVSYNLKTFLFFPFFADIDSLYLYLVSSTCFHIRYFLPFWGHKQPPPPLRSCPWKYGHGFFL